MDVISVDQGVTLSCLNQREFHGNLSFTLQWYVNISRLLNACLCLASAVIGVLATSVRNILENVTSHIVPCVHAAPLIRSIVVLLYLHL